MNVLEFVDMLRTAENSLGKEVKLFSFIGDPSDPYIQRLLMYRVTGHIHKESNAHILEVSFRETENETVNMETLLGGLESSLDKIPLNAPVVFTIEDMSRIITWKEFIGGTNKNTKEPTVFIEFFEEDSATNMLTKIEFGAIIYGVDIEKVLADAIFEDYSN